MMLLTSDSFRGARNEGILPQGILTIVISGGGRCAIRVPVPLLGERDY
jgi:hypothetical protein